ncbi:hypothetical protein Dolphis_71 [Pseudomonas phage Dolphis]|nr:hypothetical protein Dolphis_71 [Pseudomonas phage Dolphis]
MIGTPCSYVQKHYGVPACIGRRVIAYGKPGIITEDHGHYIGIALDEGGRKRPGRYHPVDGIEYGEMADKLPKPPRRTNYDKFQDEDIDCYFHEWLCIIKPEVETRGGCRYWEDGGWHYRPREYRMYRRVGALDFLARADVTGEWAPTMKAAKASYKEALKKAPKPYRRWDNEQEFRAYRDGYYGL